MPKTRKDSIAQLIKGKKAVKLNLPEQENHDLAEKITSTEMIKITLPQENAIPKPEKDSVMKQKKEKDNTVVLIVNNI